MRVAVAQIAPVLLCREETLAKVVRRIDEAAEDGAKLVAFGEALVPGYPVWIERAGGARFNDEDQKALFAHYAEQAVQIESGHLDEVVSAAERSGIAVCLGVIERPSDRGGTSLYCTSVFIGPDGSVRSAHRKLVPTYDERLTWSPGDGAGLVVHPVGEFTVGALNCWENWMPLARAALYAQGEDLHISHWPGGEHNTREIAPFLAREARAFHLAASNLLREEDIPADIPARERIAPKAGEVICDGGSCIAGPDGRFIVPPHRGEEALLVADLDHHRVFEERQNFDPSGHYARPDVLQLRVNRERQRAARFND